MHFVNKHGIVSNANVYKKLIKLTPQLGGRLYLPDQKRYSVSRLQNGSGIKNMFRAFKNSVRAITKSKFPSYMKHELLKAATHELPKVLTGQQTLTEAAKNVIKPGALFKSALTAAGKAVDDHEKQTNKRKIDELPAATTNDEEKHEQDGKGSTTAGKIKKRKKNIWNEETPNI